MNVEVKLIGGKENETIVSKLKAIVEDRSKVISKRFKIDPLDVVVEVFDSTGVLRARIDPNGEHLGVFAGYVDGRDAILIASPEAMKPVFGTNLDKETSVLVDYCLTKFYLCKKFYPERTDFKMYHKYMSESLAKVSAGKLTRDVVKFDMKTYFEGKKYRKDQELDIIFHIMLENSGLDYIYENLDQIMKDLDIKKTIFKIYKKSFGELISPIQKEILEEEKKLQRTFKPGRRR